jgi:hypothetical protein
LIDHVKFNAGEPIDDWLIEPNANELAEQREIVLALLRGLPVTDEYRAGRIRFVHTPLRDDAFTVKHAAAQEKFRSEENDPYFWFRCDTWYCDDLPFGVCKMKFTISRGEDNVVVSEQLFRVESASSFPPEATLPPLE